MTENCRWVYHTRRFTNNAQHLYRQTVIFGILNWRFRKRCCDRLSSLLDPPVPSKTVTQRALAYDDRRSHIKAQCGGCAKQRQHDRWVILLSEAVYFCIFRGCCSPRHPHLGSSASHCGKTRTVVLEKGSWRTRTDVEVRSHTIPSGTPEN
ncbi:hypothetical protein SCHPADRAFT_563106 [Schizopora paradoxa]|uniref:Uncharacterized protein n=1 Tax=Schizopora paradoxa TaxID=27342 RepID=A0A0H2RXK8_9AGAM|nr:hypothetical protein SCHPADRAFT_563106 [Schizopora paradoxa]